MELSKRTFIYPNGELIWEGFEDFLITGIILDADPDIPIINTSCLFFSTDNNF